MSISLKPVTDDHIRQYVYWRYEPPYNIYNENPFQEEEVVAYYQDPQIQAHSLIDSDGRLIGICSFGPDGRVPGGMYTTDALDIGLAIHPELTGQGQGQTFIQAVLDYAWHQYNPPACRVTIAEFNKRAQKVWQNAGFTFVKQFGRNPGGMKFVILIKENPNQ